MSRTGGARSTRRPSDGERVAIFVVRRNDKVEDEFAVVVTAETPGGRGKMSKHRGEKECDVEAQARATKAGSPPEAGALA